MKLFNTRKRVNLTIFLIFLFGLILRLYKLSEIPGGFYVDEAVIGYNAYSFLKTGKDEFGKVLPIFLRSYGAFSSSLYTYLTIPFIRIFGLSVFSTRLLSALSGSLSIIVFYVVMKKFGIVKNKTSQIAGVFIFSIIPWTVFFSRGAFESNLALLLILLSLAFFLHFLHTGIGFVSSTVFLVLSTYAYQAQRVSTLLLFPVYVYFYLGSSVNKRKGHLVYSIVIFVVSLLPQLLLIRKPAFSMRASGLFYSDAIVQHAETYFEIFPSFMAYTLSFLREFFANFFSYFSPRNLFWLGDSDFQRSVPEISVYYFWMAVPYFVGLYYLGKNIKNRRNILMVILCAVFAIPSSLTKDPFSTLRSLPLVVPITIIITLGIEKLYKYLPKSMLISISILLPLSLILLWRSYFVLFPKERAAIWSFGYEQLAIEIQERPNVGFVIDQSRRNPSYIALLFFMEYPPEKLQKLSNVGENDYYTNLDFSTDYKFANIETRNINWQEDIYEKQILVGDALAVSDQQAKEHMLTKVFEIKDPMHDTVFVGYKTNPQAKCEKSSKNSYCLEM